MAPAGDSFSLVICRFRGKSKVWEYVGTTLSLQSSFQRERRHTVHDCLNSDARADEQVLPVYSSTYFLSLKLSRTHWEREKSPHSVENQFCYHNRHTNTHSCLSVCVIFSPLFLLLLQWQWLIWECRWVMVTTFCRPFTDANRQWHQSCWREKW